MTRTYSVSRLDKNLSLLSCLVFDNSKSLSLEISALFSGVLLRDVQCRNFGAPGYSVAVEISAFLSKCQSFLTGRQACFDFYSQERF